MNAVLEKKARQIGRRISPDALRRLAETETAELRRSFSPQRYAAGKLSVLSRDYNALLEKMEQLRGKVLACRDPERRALLLGGLRALEEDLAFLQVFLVELKKGARSGVGLGATEQAAFPPWYAYLFSGWTGALLFPIGIAIAFSIVGLVLFGGERLEKILEGLGSAAKTVVTIVGVVGGVIGLIWVSRLIHDIWVPRPKTREQQRLEVQRGKSLSERMEEARKRGRV